MFCIAKNILNKSRVLRKEIEAGVHRRDCILPIPEFAQIKQLLRHILETTYADRIASGLSVTDDPCISISENSLLFVIRRISRYLHSLIS